MEPLLHLLQAVSQSVCTLTWQPEMLSAAVAVFIDLKSEIFLSETSVTPY